MIEGELPVERVSPAPSPPPLGGVLGALKALDRRIQRVEVWVCLAALATMIVLAFAQVFLRQLRGVSFGPLVIPQPVAWFDNIARHLVIWVGLLGASLATAEGRHISIEALPKILSAGGRRRVDLLVNAASLAVTATLLALSLVYMFRLQIPNEAHLFDIEALGLKIYRWPLLVVVPVGLALICFRFGVRILEAALLDDAQYAALRDAEAGQELEEAEAAQEQQQVGLLLAEAERVARESGEHSALDPDSARTEVRRALGSGGPSGPGGQPGAPGSGRGASEAEADAAQAGQDALDNGAGAAAEPEPSPSGPAPPRARPRRSPVLRSTDEIPVYRDLADDEDLLEPEVRRGGGGASLDSSDELEVSGIEDLIGEDFVDQREARAAAATTERVTLDPDDEAAGGAPDDPDGDDEPGEDADEDVDGGDDGDRPGAGGRS